MANLYWNQAAGIRINGQTSEEVIIDMIISYYERSPTKLCALPRSVGKNNNIADNVTDIRRGTNIL